MWFNGGIRLNLHSIIRFYPFIMNLNLINYWNLPYLANFLTSDDKDQYIFKKYNVILINFLFSLIFIIFSISYFDYFIISPTFLNTFVQSHMFYM